MLNSYNYFSIVELGKKSKVTFYVKAFTDYIYIVMRTWVQEIIHSWRVIRTHIRVKDPEEEQVERTDHQTGTGHGNSADTGHSHPRPYARICLLSHKREPLRRGYLEKSGKAKRGTIYKFKSSYWSKKNIFLEDVY